MGHRRISNKRMKQMLQEVLPDELKDAKSGALVEGKALKGSEQHSLPTQDAQK